MLLVYSVDIGKAENIVSMSGCHNQVYMVLLESVTTSLCSWIVHAYSPMINPNFILKADGFLIISFSFSVHGLRVSDWVCRFGGFVDRS